MQVPTSCRCGVHNEKYADKIMIRLALWRRGMTGNPSFTPSPPKLLDQVRDRLRVKHYSIRTQTQYLQWIRRFILFHDKRHPKEMDSVEVEAFLTHLAMAGSVAASTQDQALSVLLFLYREVFDIKRAESMVSSVPSGRSINPPRHPQMIRPPAARRKGACRLGALNIVNLEYSRPLMWRHLYL